MRLSNQPEAFGVPGSRSDFLARVAQTGPRLASGRCCLVGLVVTPARRSQADAARAALPPYAARAAQPPTVVQLASRQAGQIQRGPCWVSVVVSRRCGLEASAGVGQTWHTYRLLSQPGLGWLLRRGLSQNGDWLPLGVPQWTLCRLNLCHSAWPSWTPCR